MKNRSTILAWLFAFIFMVGLATTASAATISLVPSENAPERGATFTLDIVIDDPTGVAGCAFKLTYPADRLVAPDPDTNGEVLEITSVFFQQFQTTRMHRENTETAGEILFSGANINASTGGAPYDSSNPNMILFTIPFTAKSDAPLGEFDFTLEQTQLLNADAGWGDGVNPESVPVLTGAVDNAHQDWPDLTMAFPVVPSTFASPLTVTPGIQPCTDTDQDGLCDTVETNTGVYVGPEDTGTDPNNDDTDGDDLNDGAEVNTHSTNPVNSDSDGDGIPDGWEVANGHNPNNPSDPFAQLVSTDPETPGGGPGTTFSVDVYYTTTDDNQNLTGLELRIHYDSSKLTWESFTEVLPAGLPVQDDQPQDDTATDYDNDQSTDKYLTVSWSAADWPGAALPQKLYTVAFTADGSLPDDFTSVINFTAASTAAGYVFYSAPVQVRSYDHGDVDMDGQLTPQDAVNCFWMAFDPNPTPMEIYLADFDQDGQITPQDAVDIFWASF